MAKMLLDGREVDMPAEIEAALPPVGPQAVAYVPVYLVRERLEAAGLWGTVAQAIASDPAKSLKLTTLQYGLDPNDPEVVGLLQAVGADPAAILAPA